MILTYTLIFISLASTCSSGVNVRSNNFASAPATSREATVDDKGTHRLRTQIEGIAASAGGRVGVAATVLETGESISLNSAERFPMQSVYKFPIGMAVLHQVDAGKIDLARRVRVEKSDFVGPAQRSPVRDKNPNGTELSVDQLLRFMVSESDGTATARLAMCCSKFSAGRKSSANI